MSSDNCNADWLLIVQISLLINMKTAKVPKFKWGEVSELNAGHTTNEWGMERKEKPKQNVIVAYDIVWNQ